jgi:hypothetical protein
MLLIEWKAEIERRASGGPTILKMMSFVGKMLRYAVICGEIQSQQPLREVSRPRQVQKMAPAPLAPVEESKSSGRGSHRKDQTIISVLGYMGLRPMGLLPTPVG